MADGRDGFPSEAPFDCIHVGAASSEYPSKVLLLVESFKCFIRLAHQPVKVSWLYVYPSRAFANGDAKYHGL